MVAFFSEFVVRPGKTEVVCAAFNNNTRDCASDTCSVQTIVATYADAPRRVLVLHVFAHKEHAARFRDDVLPGVIHSLQPHLDMTAPLREVNIVSSQVGLLLVA